MENSNLNNRSLQSYLNKRKHWTSSELIEIYFNNQIDNTSNNLENIEEIRDEEEVKEDPPINASQVIDTIFEIHEALKRQDLIKPRDAHSALNISQKRSHIDITEKLSELSINRHNNVEKMLNCIICQELCTDVVELTCCGQIYCNSCILQWVLEQYSCPMCRSTIGLSNIKINKFVNRLIKEFNK